MFAGLAAAVLAAAVVPAAARAQAAAGTLVWATQGVTSADYGLYAAPADGFGAARRLASGSVTSLDVSPDGQRVLYGVSPVNVSPGHGLFVVPIAGGRPRSLGQALSGDAVWSPNQKQIAITNGSGVGIMPAAGGKPRTVLPDLIGIVRSATIAGGVVWNGASRLLLLATPFSITGATLPAHLSTVSTVTHRAIPLKVTLPAGWALGPAALDVAPDGRTLLVALIPTDPGIRTVGLGLVPVGGGAVTKLDGDWLTGAFSPDGNQLCAVSDVPGPNGNEAISIIDRSGHVVAATPASGTSCAWGR